MAQPQRRDMTKPGPKPSDKTARVTVTLTPTQRRRLEQYVYEKKLNEADLPPRWGISDVVRDLIDDFLATLPPPQRG